MKAKKAAGHYGVSERTIWNWLKIGLPHVKVSRNTLIDLDAGDEWLRDNFTPETKTNKDAKVVDDLLQGIL